MTRAATRAVAAALVLAGCGTDLGDPFARLVDVTTQPPFPVGCNGTPQPGTNNPTMEVEPSLAIDPTDPRHLIGAWQQDRWSNGGAQGIRAAASFDGGATWTTSELPFSRCAGGDFERASDPWVAFAADGTAYASAFAFDATTPRNAMVVASSRDGGLSWSAPVVLRFDNDADVGNDKDALTADPTDPGRLYLVWDRLTGLSQPTKPLGTGPTWLARSTAGAWEPARAIFDPGVDAQTIGNVLVVLPDGTLVVVFDLITMASSPSSPTSVAVIRSTDHGLTWSPPITIAEISPVGLQDAHQRGVRTAAGLPQIAVDRATGALYVVWEDGVFAGTSDDIAIATSTDSGKTWSRPARVNPGDAPAFDPTVAVASDGTVAVSYYDARGDDDGGLRAQVWLATSHDHGATFAPLALTDTFDLAPSIIGGPYFLGDYQGLAAAGTTFVPFFVAATSDPHDRTDVFVRAY